MDQDPCLEIRTAEAYDQRFVVQLAQQALGHLGPAATWVTGWFEDPSVGTLVAQWRSQRLGFASVLFAQHMDNSTAHAELMAIAVEQRARKMGIAQQLIRVVVDLVAKAHLQATERSIFLSVADDNRAAQCAFSKAGFVRVGQDPHPYPNGVAAWRMQRSVEACQSRNDEW